MYDTIWVHYQILREKKKSQWTKKEYCQIYNSPEKLHIIFSLFHLKIKPNPQTWHKLYAQNNVLVAQPPGRGWDFTCFFAGLFLEPTCYLVFKVKKPDILSSHLLHKEVNMILTPSDWKITKTGQIFILSLEVGSILLMFKICDSLSKICDSLSNV